MGHTRQQYFRSFSMALQAFCTDFAPCFALKKRDGTQYLGLVYLTERRMVTPGGTAPSPDLLHCPAPVA